MNNIHKDILARASKVASAAEVFMFTSEETPVTFEANRLKSVQSKQSASVSLRIFKDGRIGFATSNNLDDVDGLVSAAAETAAFGAEAKFSFPGPGAFPKVDVFDKEVEKISLDDMVKTGEHMIAAITTHTPDIICEAGVSRGTFHVSIANSSGLEAEYSKSRYGAGVDGTLVNGSDMLFVGDSDNSCRPVLDVSKLLDNVRLQLDRAKKQATVKTGKLPVIFSPDGVASALVAPLMAAFNGKIVYEGASPLASKIGLQVFDGKLSLHDDTTIDFKPGSRPFDDEGVPSQRLPLIEKGTTRNFFYDLKTAALAGKTSTGHGGRGGGAPSPGPSAFVFNNGDAGIDDMIEDIDEGLFIEQVMGATQGNILGGDFSGNVLLGYKIEKGEIVGRVKNTMVFGNVYELLKDINGMADDGKWVGGRLFTPSFYFPSLSVSSK
jgi:PmbA protein